MEIKYPDERAYSYVLASNMLSVGIDISRLGIMTVYNQPKTNAEYIQATSRVGRTYPGMVLALYSAMRSRDKSHYEQFGYYHQTFYKHVEPTSVTPFSFRAVEKGLHAVYVALIRHKIPEMRANASVVNYRKDHPAVLAIKDFILRRVADVDYSALDYAQGWLENFEDVWERTAREKHESFLYATKEKSLADVFALLIEAEKDNYGELPSTLNSLRNVDSSSNIFIVGRHHEEA